jgi:hypothetical protein
MMNISDAADAGDFVVRAYDAYHDAPSALFPAVALPPGCDFVAWVTMEDFLIEPGPNDRRFYGFIAHVTATDHYVFALRGTEGWREWWDDFHVVLVPFPGVTRDGKVAYGFRTIYETLDITYVNQDVYAFHAPHLGRMGAEQTFTEKLRSVLRVHEAERRSVAGAERVNADQVGLDGVGMTLTGHSLGGALCTLIVMQNDFEESDLKPTAIYTFASPRVGDGLFADRFDNLDLVKWRIYNRPDLVPTLPFEIFGFVHVGLDYPVDTRRLPEIKWTISCWHDIHSYLAALGVTMDPNCSCHTNALAGKDAVVVEQMQIQRRAFGH